VINVEDHHAALTTLMQLLPMSKQLTPAAMSMAWDTFPERAKLDLSGEALLFAVQQRMLDPQPPKDVAPHIALLRYVYPVNRTTRRERGEEVIVDHPMVERGLRHDLAKRMADPGQFHELVRTLPEKAPVDALRLAPGVTKSGELWHQWTPAQHMAHVQGVADAVARLRVSGTDETALIDGSMGDGWVMGQLKCGRWSFEKALQGVWPMDFEAHKQAAAWVLRNPKWADDLIALARGGELKPVAPDRVVAEFVGGRS
jgi:hypothetical protein